jgi:thiaminase/transcriptional activator TenA
MPSERFDSFVAVAPGLWGGYINHPWMKAIHDGSLRMDQFIFFLVQDMPYQTDFLNTLVLGASKSDEPESWLRMREFIVEEAEFEARLLDDLGAAWTFDRWAAGPAREGYMNHLARVGLESSPGHIAAALLPCAAGFTGAMETPTQDTSGLDPAYQRWLAYYERPEQPEFSQLLVGVFERGMAGASDDDVEMAQMIFVRSLQHQIAVFDAAWAVSDPWRED